MKKGGMTGQGMGGPSKKDENLFIKLLKMLLALFGIQLGGSPPTREQVNDFITDPKNHQKFIDGIGDSAIKRTLCGSALNNEFCRGQMEKYLNMYDPPAKAEANKLLQEMKDDPRLSKWVEKHRENFEKIGLNPPGERKQMAPPEQQSGHKRARDEQGVTEKYDQERGHRKIARTEGQGHKKEAHVQEAYDEKAQKKNDGESQTHEPQAPRTAPTPLPTRRD